MHACTSLKNLHTREFFYIPIVSSMWDIHDKPNQLKLMVPEKFTKMISQIHNHTFYILHHENVDSTRIIYMSD